MRGFVHSFIRSFTPSTNMRARFHSVQVAGGAGQPSYLLPPLHHQWNLWSSAGLWATHKKDYISQCRFRQVQPHDSVLANGV